jgi:predicted ATPase
VKWLSLISAIVTYQSIFAVEEPENFLHPKMQKIITSIIREYYLERTNIAFVLMSTHSETLINAARPSEIIVTSTNAGVTSAKRLRHRALIKQELNDTGFGLGHFYVAGALDHG